MKVIKPSKRRMPPSTVAHALAAHDKAKRNLSDTLSETGQFELKEIKAAIAKAERSGK